MDQNCLSYWFPLIEAACVPVPRTEIVRTDCDLAMTLYGNSPPRYHDFIDQLSVAVQRIGTPCFLRTGQTSAKHSWGRSCYLPDAERVTLMLHVCEIVEYSHLVDFMGLATDVWAVRELLPVRPVFTLPVYHGFPVVREFRCFVSGGKSQCVHPYWPKDAVIEGFPSAVVEGEPFGEPDLELQRCVPFMFDVRYAELVHLSDEDRAAVVSLAETAGRAVGGEWSIDILETERGWYVTDMALAAQSFHWEGCPNNKADAPF